MDISRVTIYKLVAEEISDNLYDLLKSDDMGSTKLSLTSDRNFYISALGTDSDNYEGTLEKPFRSFKRALDFIENYVLICGWTVRIVFLTDYTDESLSLVHYLNSSQGKTIEILNPDKKEVILNPIKIESGSWRLKNLTLNSSEIGGATNALTVVGSNSFARLEDINFLISEYSEDTQCAIYLDSSRVEILGTSSFQVTREEKGVVGNKIIIDNHSIFLIPDTWNVRWSGQVNSYFKIQNSSYLLKGENINLESSDGNYRKAYYILRNSVADTGKRLRLFYSDGEIDSTSQII